MTIRHLRPDEWDRLRDHPMMTKPMPDPSLSQIVIAEEGDQIVAFWVVATVVHVEPVWISPEKRKGTLPRRLWREVRRILEVCGVRGAFCFVDQPDVADYVARLGFDEFPYRPFLFTRSDVTWPQP